MIVRTDSLDVLMHMYVCVPMWIYVKVAVVGEGWEGGCIIINIFSHHQDKPYTTRASSVWRFVHQLLYLVWGGGDSKYLHVAGWFSFTESLVPSKYSYIWHVTTYWVYLSGWARQYCLHRSHKWELHPLLGCGCVYARSHDIYTRSHDIYARSHDILRQYVIDSFKKYCCFI